MCPAPCYQLEMHKTSYLIINSYGPRNLRISLQRKCEGMRKGRFPLSRACRRLPTRFQTGQNLSTYIFGAVSLLRLKGLENPPLKGEPNETGAWGSQNSIPHYWTATVGPLQLQRMRHNCQPSCWVSLAHSVFFCSLSARSQTSVRISRLWQNPPITNVLHRATPFHCPVREPEIDFAHTPPSLRTLRADVGL